MPSVALALVIEYVAGGGGGIDPGLSESSVGAGDADLSEARITIEYINGRFTYKLGLRF